MGDLKKLGALWLRQGKKGKFMSGEITVGAAAVSVLVFKNTHKEEGDKRPDYEVFEGSAQRREREPGEDDPL